MDFIIFVHFLQGLMVFFAKSEEISEAEGDDPPASDPSKKIIYRFQIHVSSVIHEALMPYHHCAAPHNSEKHSKSSTVRKVSVPKTRYIRTEDLRQICGITAKMAYQEPNPPD